MIECGRKQRTTAASCGERRRTRCSLYIGAAQTKIADLIAARAPEPLDPYANLRSRCRTPVAYELIARLHTDIDLHEQESSSRVRKRRDRSSAKLTQALQRFVGDLLRARGSENATGRVYRPIGKTNFGDDPVKYDMFTTMLECLKALGLVGYRKGQVRYYETGFDCKATIPKRRRPLRS